MKHLVTVVVFTLIAGAPIDQAPKGWRLRLDSSSSASDPGAAGTAIKFVTIGSGFHATTTKAAVFWNPANTAAGTYILKGTFSLMRPSIHVNYYGLMFGGADLEGARQTYSYFMVAQDGTWLIKRRNPDQRTQELSDKTFSAAVNRPNSVGQSTNALEVRVLTDRVEYVVNDIVVNTTLKRDLPATADGLYGFRINHLLEVHVEGLGLSK